MNRKPKNGNSLEDKYPKIAKLWHPTKNGNIIPKNINYGSNIKIWILGECGHEWQTRASRLTYGKGGGCSICCGHKVLKGFNDLLTKFPDLCKEWDYDKNINGPDCYVSGTHKKVWWKGKCGHSWYASIAHRTHERGCPICSSKIILKGFNDLLSQYPELCKEWDYQKNKKNPDCYTTRNNNKVWWKGITCGHSYIAKIADRAYNKHNCPICSGHQVLKGYNDLLTTQPKLCKEWDYQKNRKGPDCYSSGSNIKVWWKCLKNGHSWKSLICNRTHNSRPTNCPICGGKKILKGFNDLLTLRPDLCQEWDYRKNKKSPEQYTEFSNKRVWWKCTKYGHSWSTPITRRTTRKDGCPICGGHKVLKGFNDLLTKYPEICKEWDYEKNKLGPDYYTSGSNTKVWWRCLKYNHSWFAKINDRTRKEKNGCPKCKESRGEKCITEILNRFKIDFEPQKMFLECKDKRSLKFDFYLQNNNICIEYQGRQHYTILPHIPEDTFRSLQERDKIKRKYCKTNNIKLIEICYKDFDNIEEILIRELNIQCQN